MEAEPAVVCVSRAKSLTRIRIAIHADAYALALPELDRHYYKTYVDAPNSFVPRFHRRLVEITSRRFLLVPLGPCTLFFSSGKLGFLFALPARAPLTPSATFRQKFSDS